MEKRKFSRTDFQTEGELNYEGASYNCDIINVALKGALIFPERPGEFPDNAEVDLSIKLSGADIAIQATGVIVHREGQKLGIRFKSIDADSMIHLRRLLELNTASPQKISQELAFLKEP